VPNHLPWQPSDAGNQTAPKHQAGRKARNKIGTVTKQSFGQAQAPARIDPGRHTKEHSQNALTLFVPRLRIDGYYPDGILEHE
jgi:hypothetical protein